MATSVQRGDFSSFQVLGPRTAGSIARMRILIVPFAAASIIALGCAGPESIASECATLTSFCQARAQTECNAEVVASCQVKDTATCVTQRANACQQAAPQGTVYVPAAGPACLQAVATAYATATLTADALATVATTCEPVFSGPGAARAQCTVDYDCALADGLRCLIPLGQTQGKCLVPNIIPAAEPCPGEADVCSGTYFCDPQSQVCLAESAQGATCEPDMQPCMPGLFCPGGLFSTCSALGASGNACLADTDCTSNLCDKAIGQSQGVCADQIQLTALDSMCAVYQ